VATSSLSAKKATAASAAGNPVDAPRPPSPPSPPLLASSSPVTTWDVSTTNVNVTRARTVGEADGLADGDALGAPVVGAGVGANP